MFTARYELGLYMVKDENSEFISTACAVSEELVSRNIPNKIFDEPQPKAEKHSLS